ncbi:MAG TPA: hypothetical protein VGT40_18805 [Methylomirabilota bacterium]|nr:hypothetical protein [Methylomirabilota bacterium]
MTNAMRSRGIERMPIASDGWLSDLGTSQVVWWCFAGLPVRALAGVAGVDPAGK